MKKTPKSPVRHASVRRRAAAPLRAEYDFRGGVRGKFVKRFPKGTYLVLLDPDLATAFRSESAVNRALREYLRGRRK